MISLIKKVIKKIIYLAGYKIDKLPNVSHQKVQPQIVIHNIQMYNGLSRAKVRGCEPITILDVGAASGRWTEDALNLWPSAHFVLVEPLAEQLNGIASLKQRLPHAKIDVVGAVLGKHKGEVSFNVSSDLDGSGVYGELGSNSRMVPMTSLNNIQVELATQGPYLLKLDTHGFEVPILEGASEVLAQIHLIVVEVYGFYVSPTAKLFWEMCEYLDKLGFRLIDIVDLMHRPGDLAFWQCDAFFIPKSSPVFSNNAYQ
jgi:FkbM family methyltransferase